MSDEAFRIRIIAIEDVDARFAAASDAGFAFTEAELQAVQSELSDEQLDMVVGGTEKIIKAIVININSFLTKKQ